MKAKNKVDISFLKATRNEWECICKTIAILTILLSAYLLSGCSSGSFHNFDYYGFPVTSAPYDKKYKRIREHLLATRKTISYKAEKEGKDYWQLPSETDELGTGDCEDQAIWLYSNLIKEGISNIRLVIGKYKKELGSYHVWINWYHNENTYIIDPVMNDSMWKTKQYPAGYYQPLYSYNEYNTWEH